MSRRLPFCFLVFFVLFLALIGCGVDREAGMGREPRGAERFFPGEGARFAAAVRDDDLATIERMMREGFNPDLSFNMNDGSPMVAWPIYTKDKAALRKMLALGADPNAAKPHEPGNPVTLESPSFYDNAMIYAAIDPDPEYLEILIEHGGDPNARGISGDTPIHRLLVYDRPFARTEWLIANGADMEARVHGSTLLTVLMWTGPSERALRLLELGADPTPMRWVAIQRDASGQPLPQPYRPEGADSGMVYGPDGLPVLAPYLGIVEEICWGEPKMPRAREIQQRMQAVLEKRGIDCPPRPERTRR